MAYKFYSVKENNIDKENAYILYMMLGSYFGKTICRTGRMEEKLYASYCEMPDKRQLAREDRVLAFLEKELGEEAEELSDLLCEAGIVREKGSYLLTFHTGFVNFVAAVDKDGNIAICREDVA